MYTTDTRCSCECPCKCIMSPACGSACACAHSLDIFPRRHVTHCPLSSGLRIGYPSQGGGTCGPQKTHAQHVHETVKNLLCTCECFAMEYMQSKLVANLWKFNETELHVYRLITGEQYYLNAVYTIAFIT